MNVLHLANEEFLPQVCRLVDEGHAVTLLAKGNSMRPFLESDRDSVVLMRTARYAVGDVVLAEVCKGVFVIHRMDSIRLASGQRVRTVRADADAQVVLRGDGNPHGTEQCRAADLRAVVVRFKRRGRTYAATGRLWRCYSWAWTRLLPLRRPLLAAYRLLWLGEWPRRWRRNGRPRPEEGGTGRRASR